MSSQSKEEIENWFRNRDPWAECDYFAGLHMTNGYGWVSGDYAHRVIFETSQRKLQTGEIVRHKCDNRLCINPDHLEAGSLADNARDMVERGRSAKGENHSQVKLTEVQVRKIRKLYKIIPNVKIAKMFGVHRTCIDKINRREHWSHI